MLGELLETIIEELTEHWVKFLTAAGIALLGWFFGSFQARRRWAKRDFLDRLNVSLTRIDPLKDDPKGKLTIRTLLEMDCLEILLNREACKRLQSYATQTVPGKPVIPIPLKDRWFYLNSVLNELSERFAEGQIALSMGLKVVEDEFLICLTREAEGDVRTQKIRAMVVLKSLLENLPAECPNLDHPKHATRWSTMNAMAQLYKTEPDNFICVKLAIAE